MKSNKGVNTCRLCGATGEIIIPIFRNNAIIADKINKCLPLNINENDILSKYICPRCLSALNVSYNLHILSETIDKIARNSSSQFETDRVLKENAKNKENETEESRDYHQDYVKYPILEKSLKIVLEKLPDNFNNNNFEQILLKEEAFSNDEEHMDSVKSFESFEPQPSKFESIYIKIDEDFLMPEDNFLEEASNCSRKHRGRPPKRKVSLDISWDEEEEKNGRYNFREKDENYRKRVREFIKVLEAEDDLDESRDEVKSNVKRRGLEMPKKRAKLIKKKENSFSCSICDKIYRSKLGLSTHMNSHLSSEYWNYQCTKCKEKFPDIGSYTKHKYAGHPSHRTYNCNICDKTFLKENIMEAHKVEQHFYECFS